MKFHCFLDKNIVPKKDLERVLLIIYRKYEFQKKLDKIYVDFLVNFTGRISIDIRPDKFELKSKKDSVINFFLEDVRHSLQTDFYSHEDGSASLLALICSIGEYHFPVFSFSNFESVIFELIAIAGTETHLFQIAETESDARGLHMSVGTEDFGAIYFNQDLEYNSLPFGLHKVADNFEDFMHSLRVCIATTSISSDPLIIKEIGHCK